MVSLTLYPGDIMLTVTPASRLSWFLWSSRSVCLDFSFYELFWDWFEPSLIEWVLLAWKPLKSGIILLAFENGVFWALVSFSLSRPSSSIAIEEVERSEFSVSYFLFSSIFSTNCLWSLTFLNKESNSWRSSVSKIWFVLWTPVFTFSSFYFAANAYSFIF